MARDYQQEYQKALDKGWKNNEKKVSVSFNGRYIDGYYELLKTWDCKTLGEFVRNIIDGKLSVTKRF